MYRNDGETMTIAEQMGYGSDVSTEEALDRAKERMDAWNKQVEMELYEFYQGEIDAGRMTYDEAFQKLGECGFA